MCVWESHIQGCRAGSWRPTWHERLRNDDLDYDVRINFNTVSLCYPHIGHISTIITLGRFICPSRSPPSSSPHSLAPPSADVLLSCFFFFFFPVSSVTSSLLPPSKAPVSALTLSPAVLITQSERMAYLSPSLLYRVLLRLLVSPEGSHLLPQCTQSWQTTDTGCILVSPRNVKLLFLSTYKHVVFTSWNEMLIPFCLPGIK